MPVGEGGDGGGASTVGCGAGVAARVPGTSGD
jgi:hypothetical protein